MVFSALLHAIAPRSDLSLNVFPPKSTFDPARDMPDMTGKVVIVTGGNAGIGYESIKHLLAKNAKVYLTARSTTRGQTAVDELKRLTGKDSIELLHLDLADLVSVRKAATEFLEKEKKLDVLFNNAGVLNPPLEDVTKQGYDSQFGTNVVGPYLFTKLLIPALEAASASGSKARIVTTSSALHASAPPTPSGIDYSTLKDTPERLSKIKTWGTVTLYGQSKLANTVVSQILTHDYPSIASCSLHPGVIRSNLMAANTSVIMKVAARTFFQPIEYGPLTQLYAGTAVKVEEMDGKYFVPWARLGEVPAKAADKKNQAELRNWLEEQVAGF